MPANRRETREPRALPKSSSDHPKRSADSLERGKVVGIEFVLLIASYFPPQHLRINGEDWNVLIVKQVEAGSGFDGQTHCETRTIEIEATGPEEMRDVAVHELLHALACDGKVLKNDSWNNKRTGYHAGIYRMAPRLLAVIRENKGLTEFLQR